MIEFPLITHVTKFQQLEHHLQVIQVNQDLALQEGAIEFDELLFTTAVYKGNVALVTALVQERCIDPGLENKLGLRWSAYVGHAEMVAYFLELGLYCEEAKRLAKEKGYDGIVYLFDKFRNCPRAESHCGP